MPAKMASFCTIAAARCMMRGCNLSRSGIRLGFRRRRALRRCTLCCCPLRWSELRCDARRCGILPHAGLQRAPAARRGAADVAVEPRDRVQEIALADQRLLRPIRCRRRRFDNVVVTFNEVRLRGPGAGEIDRGFGEGHGAGPDGGRRAVEPVRQGRDAVKDVDGSRHGRQPVPHRVHARARLAGRRARPGAAPCIAPIGFDLPQRGGARRAACHRARPFREDVRGSAQWSYETSRGHGKQARTFLHEDPTCPQGPVAPRGLTYEFFERLSLPV